MKTFHKSFAQIELESAIRKVNDPHLIREILAKLEVFLDEEHAASYESGQNNMLEAMNG